MSSKLSATDQRESWRSSGTERISDKLVLTSTPPSVSVSVDGNRLGTTPIETDFRFRTMMEERVVETYRPASRVSLATVTFLTLVDAAAGILPVLSRPRSVSLVRAIQGETTMPFYVRKSFKAGPVRLNLSKRGLGVSVGVKGARLGVSSNGRAYVSGGRGGLYFRENLGGSATRTRRNSHRSGSAETIVLEKDTGATYSRHGTREEKPEPGSLEFEKPRHHLSLAIFGTPALAAAAIVTLFAVVDERFGTAVSGWVAAIGLTLAGILWVATSVRQGQRVFRAYAFGRALSAAISDSEYKRTIGQLSQETKATPADILYHARTTYLEPISKMPQQDADASKLDEAEEVLGVSFVPRDQAPIVLEPCEQALDLPAFLVAA